MSNKQRIDFIPSGFDQDMYARAHFEEAITKGIERCIAETVADLDDARSLLTNCQRACLMAHNAIHVHITTTPKGEVAPLMCEANRAVWDALMGRKV